MYFEELQVKKFLSWLADNLPSAEIMFYVRTKLDNHIGAWIVQLLPNQQKVFRRAWGEALKKWWQNEPQHKKENLLATLTTNTKPHSTKWADLESWWKQISASEKETARHDVRSIFSNWSYANGL